MSLNGESEITREVEAVDDRAQIEAFLGASDQVAITAHAGDTECYALAAL